MNRDLYAGASSLLEFLPIAARTATATSAAVDLGNYDGNVAFLFATEEPTGTDDPTLTFTLTHSETEGGSYTAVSGFTSGAITAAAASKVVVNSDRLKRWVKVVGTISGTTPSFACSAYAVAIPRS